MFLDPEFLPVYESLPEMNVFADVPGARAALLAASGDGKSDGEVNVEDRAVAVAGAEGAEGHTLGLRVYTPVSRSDAPLPVAVWIHGGGFVLGGPNAEDATCRRLTAELGIAIVAPDYRLAPEHPYPAAFDDCYAALRWVVDEADALGVDVARLALGGHSAGAALVAAVALAARDRQGAAAGWEFYLQGSDPEAGYAVPGRAKDLRDLPASYILVDGVDPARDEALEFAARLSAAGNSVELHLVPGVPHMFDVLAPGIRASRRAVAAWTSAFAHGIGAS